MVTYYLSPKTLKEAYKLAQIVIEERTNEIYLLEANLHESRNNQKHRVTIFPPYVCSECKWKPNVRPALDFEIIDDDL